MIVKRFIENSSRVIAAFLLTGATAVAIWNVVTIDYPNDKDYAQNVANNVKIHSTVNNPLCNADFNQVK